jgi:hypothetical protein
MAQKKRGRLAPHGARPALELLRPPQSSGEVVTLLRFAAHEGLAPGGIVTHLEEMAALFPDEMLGAYRALCARRACNN